MHIRNNPHRFDTMPVPGYYIKKKRVAILLFRLSSDAKEEIEMANEILSNISKDEIERAHYLSRKKFLMDMEHSQSAARKEGLSKGMAEGRAEERAKVAKKLLDMNMPIADIAETTGLSRAEIERLR
jgi:predicted transposase/invertase (TIGR01784 family)